MKGLRLPIAFASVTIFWALSWIFIKIGVRDFPPFLFAGIRCILSAGVLFAYAKVAGVPMRLQTVSTWINFLIGMCFFGIPFMAIFTGEKTVDASVAAVVFGCSPIFTVTMARIFLGERLTRTRVFAVLIGLCGITYLYLPAIAETGIKANWGLLLILAGCVCGSCGTILAKRKLRHESAATSLPNQMILVGPVILAASLLTESRDGINLSGSFVFSLLYLSLLSSGLAYVLYFWMLKHMPIAQLVYIDFIFPILSIIFGRVILDEPVSSRLAIAALLIVTGGILATRGRYASVPEREPAAPC